MCFRIGVAFWGVLIGSLLCSSVSFSQVVQGGRRPPRGKIQALRKPASSLLPNRPS